MRRLAYTSKLALVCLVVAACESTEDESLDSTPAANAPIAPPTSLGESKPAPKQGGMAGIPGADRNDVEIILPYNAGEVQRTEAEKRRREFAAQQTDREVAGSAQDSSASKKLGDVDRQLGLEAQESNGNAPSFTLGVQKIKGLFKDKQFEEALLETNDLLKYYPRSAQLLLMKGTLHQRMSQIDLALMSYQRAFEYEPSRKLQAQITSLKQVLREREELRRQREGIVKPGGASVKIEAIPQPTTTKTPAK